MPQNFITNITIKLNKQALDTTFENLILHDSLEDTGGKEKNPDRDKFNRNLEVMKYLEKENANNSIQLCHQLLTKHYSIINRKIKK